MSRPFETNINRMGIKNNILNTSLTILTQLMHIKYYFTKLNFLCNHELAYCKNGIINADYINKVW